MSKQQASTSKKVNVSTENTSSSSSSSDDHPIPELLALPDVPLQSVISYIPLQSLITTVPLLHSRLSTFRQIALNQNRHLILHLGNRGEFDWLKRHIFPRLAFGGQLIDPTTGKLFYPQSSPIHHLHLPTLEHSTPYQLKALMPDISHLEIFIAGADILIIPNLIQLLTLWSSTLVSLKFHAKFHTDHSTPREESVIGFHLLRLLDSINTKLSSLQHLTLDLHDYLFEESQAAVTLEMPILGQLREFYMASYDHQRFMADALREYATETLQVVGLWTHGSWVAYLEALAAGTFRASSFIIFNSADRLAEEPIDNMEDYIHMETRFLSTFTSLREITLNLKRNRFLTSFAPLLSPFRQLISLRLTVLALSALTVTNTPDWRLLLPLTSVQILTIDLVTSDLIVPWAEATHNAAVSPLWAHLFPSVQILVFIHCTIRFCTVCYPEVNPDGGPLGGAFNRTLLPCIRQYLAPLMVLPSLRQIFYSRYYRLPYAEFNSNGDFVQVHDDMP